MSAEIQQPLRAPAPSPNNSRSISWPTLRSLVEVRWKWVALALPILRGVRTTSGCNYVKAFVAASDEAECEKLISGFKQQSFWPAGDAWAMLLIFLNVLIGLNMLVPAFDADAVAASVHAQSGLISVSLAVTGIFWAAFRFGLALKYPVLVDLPKIGGGSE